MRWELAEVPCELWRILKFFSIEMESFGEMIFAHLCCLHLTNLVCCCQAIVIVLKNWWFVRPMCLPHVWWWIIDFPICVGSMFDLVWSLGFKRVGKIGIYLILVGSNYPFGMDHPIGSNHPLGEVHWKRCMHRIILLDRMINQISGTMRCVEEPCTYQRAHLVFE